MRRQFLRFYICIIVVLLLAGGGFYLFNEQSLERTIDKWFEESMGPAVDRLRENLAEAPADPQERARVLEEASLSPSFRSHRSRRPPRPRPSAEMVKKSDLSLSGDMMDRLGSGEVVVDRDQGSRLVYADVGAGDVVVIGPFPDFRGRDTGRGESIFSFLVPPLIIVMLIGTAIYFLIRPIERRISALIEVTERFGEGVLSSRAQVGRTGTIDELEQSFNAMAVRIEELVNSQKELLRAVSHDLRTPLARVFFALDDALTAPTPDEKNNHLKRIDRSLVDLNDLVDELLTYIHLDEASARSGKIQVDLSQVIRDAADLVSEVNPEITLETTCDREQAFAEPRYLRRALQNLVTNAVRHASKGVWITCRQEEGTFCLSVDDDGPGIPEGEREKIFEPFYRLDHSRNSNLGGSGLGLAIVARIMAWHGGSVRAMESPHGGARFLLTFPNEP